MNRLSDRAATMEWTSPVTARLMGAHFYLHAGVMAAAPNGEILVLKPPPFLDAYVEVLSDSPTRNVLDLGMWQGGSAMLFAALLDAEKLVAVDILGHVPPLEEAMAAHPEIGRRIRPHFNTSQDDEAALNAILDAEFEGPVDLVVDDASHHYGLTRRSFEILFPRLAPGGWYVIEDWAWAHMPDMLWPDEPSLASLIFQIQLAWYSRPDIIGKVVMRREMAFIQKAETAPVGGTLDLETIIQMHHRKFELIR